MPLILRICAIAFHIVEFLDCIAWIAKIFMYMDMQDDTHVHMYMYGITPYIG